MTWNDLCKDLLPPQAPLHIETVGMTAGEMALDVAVTSCAGPLSDLYPTVDARPQSLSADAGRSAVGDHTRAAASPCPPILV